MKTTTIFLMIAVFLPLNAVLGQPGKGGLILGGTANFTNQFIEEHDDIINFSVYPQIGYFVSPTFALGGTFGLNHFKSGGFNDTDFSLGPFARYYIGRFPKNKVWFFVHAKTEYLSNEGDYRLSGGNGISVFLSPSTAFEALGVLQYTGGEIDKSQLGLQFGFQVYLNKKE